MDDQQILSLYWERSESAIAETDAKYGGYCYSISYNILENREDARECVNDTYLAAWRAIPPRRPSLLGAFLGKITRHLSIDRWRSRSADKRGGGETALALEELEECVSHSRDMDEILERKRLVRVFNEFLEALPETERRVFLCRYWYMDPSAVIAKRFGFSDTKVRSMLHRTRKKLRQTLEKEELL